MTLSLERARARTPITWLTLLGILLLPAALGGILVAALHSPAERLDSLTAAIVNLDEPVTINDQYTPLGRQLAAGLVEGSDDVASNLTWVISNEDDATAGLADGTYQAVITIPAEFSAAATSAGQAISDGGGAAEQATIEVTTPDDGLLADDLIATQLADAAAATLGDTLAEATTENVLVGFTTIGDQIGDAADGASQLADGAADAAEGAAAIPEGARGLSSGASSLAGGAGELAGGLDTIAANTDTAASGATSLGDGLTQGADTLTQSGLVPDELFAAAQGTSQAASGVSGGVSGLSQQLTAVAAACAASGAAAEYCAQVQALADGGAALVEPAATAAAAAAGTSGGLSTFDSQATAQVASQLRTAGSGAASLADGLTQLAQGSRDAAAGARELQNGANSLAEGGTSLADGADTLVTGLDSLSTGTTDLADGLATASESLPSFTDSESQSIASVIADPVAAAGGSDPLGFGPTAIPLLAAVVLWLGALATFVALRAYTARALTSRRSSAALTLRAFAPAAAIGVGQALLVSAIVQSVANFDAATWWTFAGTATLAAITFAAVNQALVAIFGGVGRWISAVIGMLAIATGLVSTVPGWLASIGQVLPTAPAFAGLIAGNGQAITALVVWGVLAIVATTIAVSRARVGEAKRALTLA